MKIRGRRTRQLWVERLESRDAPALDFQILTLTADNFSVQEHKNVTGDDNGGIAISNANVFVTGDTTTGGFPVSNLSGGVDVGSKFEALTSNLRDGKVYTLANNGVPLTSAGGTVSQLIEIDGGTGALTNNIINLTGTISVGNGSGIFAGYGRIVLHATNGNAFEVALPSGTVTNLGAMNTPAYNPSDTWAYWGVTEHFGGADYVAYVAQPIFGPATKIDRMEITTGSTQTIETFSNLADMASFTVSPATNRWYFHHEGDSQFYTGAPFNDDEIVGFADATFQLPGLLVENTNDSGTGSLRQALADADANPGFDVINFAPGVTGTISLQSNLTVAESVRINGPGSGTVTVQGGAGSLLFVPTTSNAITLTLGGLTLKNTATAQTFNTSITSIGDLVIDGTGSGDIAFAKNLTVQTDTLTVLDGNGIELGPLSTVDGTLDVASGMSLGTGETLNGDGEVKGNVAIGSGGKLAGSLTVTGNVTANSGGIVAPGNSPGAITINGNLLLQSGAKLDMELDGAASANYDRLIVSGTVDIGGGSDNLDLAVNFTTTPGTSFILIANGGSDTVAGQLLGVRNRAGKNLDGTFFQFRYDGGDGNDVELIVNSAPAVDPAITSTLTPILEDTPVDTNFGSKIYDLVGTGSLYSDAQGLFRSGVAVTGLDTANGTWQYSIDGGTSWTTFGSVSAASATLLESDAAGQNRVRFLPVANFYGTPGFSFRAWDTTDGRASGDTGVNVSAGGGNNPFSAQTETSTLPVLSVNDAPDAVNDTATLNEDGGAQTINVLANDSFAPDLGETLVVATVTQGRHGTVAIGPGGLSITYTPDPDYAGPDSFLYSIADGNGGSDFASVVVNVVNDAADRLEVVTSPGTVTFTEGGGAVTVDAGVQVGSGLEGVISSAVVKFTSGYVRNKDKLVFTPIVGIPLKGVFSPATGALTLRGVATPEQYETALRAVRYLNTSPAPVDGIRKLSFWLQDAAGVGEAATKLLNVVGVNSKPVVVVPAKALTYRFRGRPLGVGGGLRITDIDNTRLLGATVRISGGFDANDMLSVFVRPTSGIAVSYNTTTGVLTLTGNATLGTYLAALRSLRFSTTTGAAAGTRTIEIKVNDGLIDSDAVTRTVNVV